MIVAYQPTSRPQSSDSRNEKNKLLAHGVLFNGSWRATFSEHCRIRQNDDIITQYFVLSNKFAWKDSEIEPPLLKGSFT